MDAKEMLGKTLYEKIMKAAEEAMRDGTMKSLPENLQEISSFVTFCRYKNRGDFSIVDENDVRVAASRVKAFGEKAFPVRRY